MPPSRVQRSNHVRMLRTAAVGYGALPLISLDGDEASTFATDDLVYLPDGLTITSHGGPGKLVVNSNRRAWEVNAKEVASLIVDLPWALSRARAGGLLTVACYSAARVPDGNGYSSFTKDISEIIGCRATGVSMPMYSNGKIIDIRHTDPSLYRLGLDRLPGWTTYDSGKLISSMNFARLPFPVAPGPHAITDVPGLLAKSPTRIVPTSGGIDL